MDYEELRRKRMRIFSPSAEAAGPQTSHFASSTSYTDAGSSAAAPIDLTAMDADEQFARQLQAEYDTDEQLAHDLQAEFDTYKPLSKKKERKHDDEAKIRPSAPSSTHEVDNSNEAVAIRAFANSTLAVECACCGRAAIGGEDDLIQQFTAQIKLSSKQFDLISAMGATVADEALVRVGIALRCPHCNKGSTCMGCGTAILTSSEQYGSHRDGLDFMWHCDTARLVHAWFLLCGYDNQVKHNKLQLRESDSKTSKKTKRNQGAGIGYGKEGKGPSHSTVATQLHHPYSFFEEAPTQSFFAPGPGNTLGGGVKPVGPTFPKLPDAATSAASTSLKNPFGDDYDEEFEDEDDEDYMNEFETDAFDFSGATQPAKNMKYKPSQAPVVTDPDDDITAKVMSAVTLLLPQIEGRDVPTQFDFQPPQVLTAMLIRSSILDKAAELLRNDSLEDVTRRGGLYESLFAFIKTLGSHPTTSALIVHGERIVNRAGHDLLKVSMGQPTRELKEKSETSPPLATCLTNLSIAAQTMINRVQVNEKEFQAEEDQRMLFLCYNICDLAALLKANAPAENRIQAWEKEQDGGDWQKELMIMEVPDDVMLSNNTLAAKVANMTNPPIGRMRALIKDITRLQTGLPPGIFVRHGTSRLDLMKILIVGPKDTPYEHGLWEFDLFCPAEYPNVPPLMSFRTTGNGRVGVNPNLYPDGKVCLSLLGTWQGETWQPGTSTLLQVLVSIQAMILCDEPWCNEPGCERDMGSEASKNYNRERYPMTVRYGMLEWLGMASAPRHSRYDSMTGRTLTEAEKPAKMKGAVAKAGIWQEVVEKHFAVNEQAIVETVGRWTKDKPSGRALKESSNSNSTTAKAWARKWQAVEEREVAGPGPGLVEVLKGALKQLPSVTGMEY